MAELEIPDLPLITDLSLDDIIPAVQEGMARHVPLSALLALMFSNIKVVENDGRISIKFLEARIHFQYHPGVAVERENNNTLLSRSGMPGNPWAEPFTHATKCFAILPSASASYYGDISATTSSVRVTTDARTDFPRVVLYREDGPTWGSGTEVRDIAAFALGVY